MDRPELSKKKERMIDTCINVFFILLFICSLVVMIAIAMSILSAIKFFVVFLLSALATA